MKFQKFIPKQKRISFSLIKELKQQIKKHEVLLYIYTYSSYMAYVLLTVFKKLPIIGCQIGHSRPLKILERKPKLFFIYPLFLIEELIERIVYRHIDYFIVVAKKEKKDVTSTS